MLPNEKKALEPAVEQPSEEAFALMCKDHSHWYRNESREEVIWGPLMRLCATYLCETKRGSRVLDPVAHFHLSNGASMYRINWLADTSLKGFRQSAGMMINYLYKSGQIEKNHEAYSAEGKIRKSAIFRSLLKT